MSKLVWDTISYPCIALVNHHLPELSSVTAAVSVGRGSDIDPVVGPPVDFKDPVLVVCAVA